MKVAILGGGFAGMACAFDSANSHEVTLFEGSPILGGLASGFSTPSWEWPIEKAYHHLFANDLDIIQFATDIGYKGISFSTPITASLFEQERGIYEITPFDSPGDLLRFKYLDIISKLRTAIALGVLKLGPNFPIYEKTTTYEYMRRITGDKSWNILWEQLMRKKFGNYAEKILMSFLWARIHKRTKSLGYCKGGFQTFIDCIEKILNKKMVNIRKGTRVMEVTHKNGKFEVVYEQNDTRVRESYDAVISTLPSPILPKITSGLFSKQYLARFSRLQYLSALVLLFETKKPLIDNIYWLNICTPSIPMMLIGQHTNFVDPKHYGGNHLAYVGYYLEPNDQLINMSPNDLTKMLWPHITNINPKNIENNIINTYRFYGPYAQPLFTKNFVKDKPEFITPIKRFYIANLDMTYPYDRGTNYAVQLGRKVASILDADCD